MYIGGRVDSSEVGALENQRSGRPSGGFVDSAGTARTLMRATLAGGGLVMATLAAGLQRSGHSALARCRVRVGCSSGGYAW